MRGARLVVGAVALLSLGGGLAGCGGHTNPTAAAAGYIKAHYYDFGVVQASVQTVQIEAGTIAKGSTSMGGIDGLAKSALQSETAIGNVMDAFATADPVSGSTNTWVGARELHGAMKAFFAWVGNQNPATLATTTVKFHQAIADWDSGVTALWKTAHENKPPTL